MADMAYLKKETYDDPVTEELAAHYREILRLIGEDGALRSTKKGPHHGYGTKIVAEIAAKYNGIVEYFESGGMFGVQIMLPEKDKEKRPQ